MLSWLGFCKKAQQYTMYLHVMVTCPVLLFLMCFVTFMSYLVIFICVFSIFGRMNSRITQCIKGAWDLSKLGKKQVANQSGSKQAGTDRTRSTHRTQKSNRLNTRLLGYLSEHRLRKTNTRSKSITYSIYSHTSQYISMKNDIEKQEKIPEPTESSSTGKMRERSTEDTMTDRPMTSALTLFLLPHQMEAPFFDGKEVSDFILQ